MASADISEGEPVRHRVAGLLPPRRRPEARADPVPAATAQQLDASDPQVVDLLRDEAGRRLDQQHVVIAQLDTKAAGLVAAGIALVSYLVAADSSGPLVLAALAAHAGVVIMGLGALSARSWSNAPNLVAKADWVKLATWCLGLAMVLTCTARLT